jgi:hypothetical protein
MTQSVWSEFAVTLSAMQSRVSKGGGVESEAVHPSRHRFAILRVTGLGSGSRIDTLYVISWAWPNNLTQNARCPKKKSGYAGQLVKDGASRLLPAHDAECVAMRRSPRA